MKEKTPNIKKQMKINQMKVIFGDFKKRHGKKEEEISRFRMQIELRCFSFGLIQATNIQVLRNVPEKSMKKRNRRIWDIILAVRSFGEEIC